MSPKTQFMKCCQQLGARCLLGGLALLMPGLAGSGTGTWTTSGPEGGSAFGLAQDPATASTLFVATGNGVFKSTDSAGTWSAANSGLPSGLAGLEIAPDGTLWTFQICCITSKLFKSSDGGATWVSVDPGVGSPTALAVDPSDSSTLYVGTRADGVLKSADAGGTWNAVNSGLVGGLGTPQIMALAIHPTTPAILYAATRRDGVFKSTNAGSSWSPVNTGLEVGSPPTVARLNTLAIDPVTPATLYAGTSGNGAFKTTDGGASWSPVSAGLPSSANIRSIGINPLTPMTLYCSGGSFGGADTVFKSLDGGGTWSDLEVGIPGLLVRAVLVDRATPGSVYAATSAGVLESPDSGATWNDANSGLRAFAPLVLVVDPSDPNVVYTADFGIFKSLDGGASWSAVNNGLTDRSIGALAVAPSLTSTLYAATFNEIFRSTDGGGAWSPRIADPGPFGALGVSLISLAVDTADPDTVFAGNQVTRFAPLPIDPAILKSTDGAANWTGVYSPAPTDLLGNGSSYTPWEFATDPSNPNRMLLGGLIFNNPGSQFDVLLSTDGGDSWARVLSEAGFAESRVAFDPTTPANVYVGGIVSGSTHNLFKSSNAGASFSPFDVDLECVRDVEVDPDSSSVLYAACRDLHVSFDGGATWGVLTDDSIPSVLRVVAVPSTSRTLYISTFGGIYSNTLSLADLSITKTDQATEVEAGGPITYTIEASNPLGPDEIVGAEVGDSPPAELASCSWTCAGGGGGVCTPGPVAGGIADSVTLPVGGTVTYTLSCTLDPGASGTLVNTATVSMPAGAVDPFPAGDSSSDSDLVLVFGGCGFFNDRDLAPDVISETIVIEACRTIRVGTGYEIQTLGDVTLRAGRSVAIDNGLVVSGRLTVELDPALDM